MDVASRSDDPIFPIRSLSHFFILAGLAVQAFLGAPANAQDPVELLSHLDVGNTYNDIWGYSAPDGTELAIVGTVTSTLYVDVTDPAKPVVVAEVPGETSVWRDMKTYGHYVYTVNDEDGGLQIVDVESPLEPRFVLNTEQFFRHSHNVFIDEEAGVLYAVGTDRGMVLLDLTQNPESPVHIANFNEFYIHDVYTRDGLAYAAAINSRMLAILDVSDLPNVRVNGTIRYPGAATHNTWLTEDGRYCVTTDETSGGHIKIFDVIDPSRPVEVGEWEHPEVPNSSVHNVHVKNGYAYIAWYVNGLEILDLTDPTQPVRAGSYDTYPGAGGLYDGAWGVYPYARSGNIYVSDISSGLYVFSFAGNSCTLTGTTRDARTGEAIADVELRVESVSRTLLSGPDGRFAMRVPPGEHELQASIFGYETLIEPFSIELEESKELELLLAPLPSGTVAGHVRDDDGAPVSIAHVTLQGTPLVVNLDQEGAFTIPRVPTGSYVLVAEATGIHGFDTTVEVMEGETSVADLTVYPSLVVDEMESDRDWTVGAPGDGATSGIWELGDPHGTELGTVQPEDDHTPDGTMCWVTGNSGPDAEIGDDDVDDGATTLTSPVYDLSGVSKVLFSYYRWFTNSASGNGGVDPLVVSASNDGGASWVELERIIQSAPEWVRVEFALEEHLGLTSEMQFRFYTTDIAGGSVVEAAIDDLEVAAVYGRILGEVVDEYDGKPIENASIELDVSGSPVTLQTDVEGRFAFVTAPDSVHVTVRSSLYHEFEADLVLGSFQTAELPVELRRKTAPLSGFVVANGAGVPAATVRIADAPFSTTTDGMGRFSFPAVWIGPHQIVVEKPDYAGDPTEIDISEEGMESLVLELEPEFETGTLGIGPNPFRESTSLSYRLARPAHVRVAIYDPSGRQVRTLLDEPRSIGRQQLEWDGRDDGGRRLPGGIYFQRFEADGEVDVRRVVMLR